QFLTKSSPFCDFSSGKPHRENGAAVQRCWKTLKKPFCRRKKSLFLIPVIRLDGRKSGASEQISPVMPES
ncbi:MAG: hypothetical protein KDH84_12335, partial [Calditrichaeota bacterium]|nr:hypothetical protein [Calditrichota bacterium]